MQILYDADDPDYYVDDVDDDVDDDKMIVMMMIDSILCLFKFHTNIYIYINDATMYSNNTI